MKSTPSPRVRFAAVLALILCAGAGAYLLLHGSSKTSAASNTAATQVTSTTTTPATKTQTTVKRSSRPHEGNRKKPVEGVNALDAALKAHPIVVVSVYARNVATDSAAMKEAQAGAAEVGAGFVAFNVYQEKLARQLATLVGSSAQVTTPTVLFYTRPRKLAFALKGFADSQVVAQAAQNVFPHVEPWVNDANRICARFITPLGVAQAQAKSADITTAAGRKQAAAALERAAALLNQEAQALGRVRTTVGKAKTYAQVVIDLKQVSSNISSEAGAIRRNDQTTAQATEQTNTKLIATLNALASSLQLTTCAS
jgi:hypothetical protein